MPLAQAYEIFSIRKYSRKLEIKLMVLGLSVWSIFLWKILTEAQNRAEGTQFEELA
jgi:hypothetical protein